MEIAELGVEVEFLLPESEEAAAPLNWSSAGVTEVPLSDNDIVQQLRAAQPVGSNGHRLVHLKVAVLP